MKVLKFDNCKYLTEISDLSCLPNLVNFSFQNCENLTTIHNSIGFLNKLEFLNANGCIKLKSFPPLKLACLKDINISHCKSLQSFPEILGKIETINSIDIRETSISDLPISFQNLTGLANLSIGGSGMFRLPSFISMMPKLSKIWVSIYNLLMASPTSTVSSNVKCIYLQEINLSDECLPIFLMLFPNVEELDIVGCNYKILPECLKECRRLQVLRANNCKSLEEIRGIPPNIDFLSAVDCKSLNSSSRRMLMNRVIHYVLHKYLINISLFLM
jgi:Leucine-rich repeat (LRR) protein